MMFVKISNFRGLFSGLIVSIGSLICFHTSAQISQIRTFPLKEIAHASGDSIMHFPSAIAFDAPDSNGIITKKILVSWGINKDDASLFPKSGWKSSVNGGLTFGRALAEPNISFLNAIKLRNGKIITIPFKLNDRPTNETVFTFSYHTSTDNGITWRKHPDGRVDFGTTAVKGIRLHRGIIEENDGSLYCLGYGAFVGDKVSRVFILKSVDGGTSWTYFNTIAKDPVKVFNEATIVRCVNGSWLVVMRNESWKPLYYSRSADKGVNWTQPKQLPGLPTNSTPGDDLNESVDPHLLLMPNGILVLSYGRPNLHLAFSEDGNGTNWSNITTTFVEVQNVLETSSYSVLLPVDANRLFLIHDSGANWSYPKEILATRPNPYSILGGFVDVLRNETNRIDLKNLYKQGKITVNTDMIYSNSNAPETGISGAFDGSTDYWSGAFKSGRQASYVINLDQAYTITDIALSLHIGNLQSAAIRFSTDGKKWTKPVLYKNRIHYAMEYKKLKVPVSSRYVKVDIDGVASMVSLNEIELYGTPKP
ncbi:MAG TPA: exo-alpha-sialidase [Sphingobacteriaceae bacterium]